jgi:hypothetical protein
MYINPISFVEPFREGTLAVSQLPSWRVNVLGNSIPKTTKPARWIVATGTSIRQAAGTVI